ncbi:MAG: hypothetical protein J6Q43_05750, partial [Bacteroidaceae bacterium]|nr:hypothetical protein [Bacteroidaceae bacterium]
PFFALFNACRCIGHRTELRGPMQRSDFANATQCFVEDESRAVNVNIECGYKKTRNRIGWGCEGFVSALSVCEKCWIKCAIS